jgi:hypothetical protein
MRPADLALLLLASEELRPRKRLRSQYPDIAGLELKRSLLQRIAALDPDPNNLEATLARLIDELGPPPGPIRALAIGFRDDWQGLASNPDWLEQLREEAARAPGEKDSGTLYRKGPKGASQTSCPTPVRQEGGSGGGPRLHS